MLGANLLKRRKYTNVADEHSEKKVLNIITLGRRGNTLNLLLQCFGSPLGNLRKKILKCTQNLFGLLVPLARRLRVVINTPKPIGNVGDQSTTQILAKSLLDKVGAHLFTREESGFRKPTQ